LIATLGFEPVEAGPLENARLLESLAELMVYLVRARGYGPAGAALRLLIREEGDGGTRAPLG